MASWSGIKSSRCINQVFIFLIFSAACMPSLESDGRAKASRVAKTICCLQPRQRISSNSCGRSRDNKRTSSLASSPSRCSTYSTRCECRVMPALFRSHGKLHISHTKQAVHGIFWMGQRVQIVWSRALRHFTILSVHVVTHHVWPGSFSPALSKHIIGRIPSSPICPQDPIVSNDPPIPGSGSILCIINRPSFRSSKACQLHLISMVLHCQ
jgi:hypothetical protein